MKINEYSIKMKNIKDNLKAISEIIMEPDLVYYILGDLGFKFVVVSKNFIYRIHDVTLVEVYSRLLAHESKLENYNTFIVINIGDNSINLSSYANNVVNFSSTVTSNEISMNLSTSDFGDLKFGNVGFVRRNTNRFIFVSPIGLVGNYDNMNINIQ